MLGDAVKKLGQPFEPPAPARRLTVLGLRCPYYSSGISSFCCTYFYVSLPRESVAFSPAPCSWRGWCWVNIDVRKLTETGLWKTSCWWHLILSAKVSTLWSKDGLRVLGHEHPVINFKCLSICVFWSRERVNGFQILRRVYDLENLKTIQVGNWQSGLCGDGLGLRLHIISLETRC